MALTDGDDLDVSGYYQNQDQHAIVESETSSSNDQKKFGQRSYFHQFIALFWFRVKSTYFELSS
jgi:hypothetical protein